MAQHPLHQAILSLSRDDQLPGDTRQAAALLPFGSGAVRTEWIPTVNARELLSDPRQLRSLLLSYTERVIALEAKIAADAPKVAFYDAVVDADDTQSIQDVAKILGIGATRFFAWLHQTGILMPNNLPYQCHIDAGYFKVIQRNWTDKKSEHHQYARSLVTGKGLAYLQRRYRASCQESAAA